MDEVRSGDHVDTIREVFSYLKQFRGKTFVVKIDSAVLDDPLFPSLVKDLSLLRESGIRIAIAPSAKERIDEVLGTYKVQYRFIKGVRVTSEQAMPFIKMAAFDVSNKVMTMLAANGITAVIGNWVRARGIGVIDGVDFQSAGIVESVRVDNVRRVLEDGMIPIFPCIGWSSVGTPYNISSNELAVVVATTLGAEKLFYVTARPFFSASSFNVPERIPIAPGGRLANFSLADVDRFIAANPGRESDLELLQRARRACAGGVERVHILDGRNEGVILKEAFSNLGSGTMVYSNRYGGIRPMSANDISDVLRIMRPFVEKGVLVPRSEAQLEAELQDFIVFEVDDSVHACAALHTYPEGTAEIAGIAVDEHFNHLGVGPKLVDFLIERARRVGLGS
ncbi:MAG TPA: amino-acid N-acetyltransferase, partial [Spirochaetia bacterium]